MRHVFLVGLVVIGLPLVLSAQQPAGPTRDTIVVMRRDTVVVLRRDTVFIQAPPAQDRERLPPGRGGGYVAETPEERRARFEEARQGRLDRLQQMREERDAYYAALPPVRTSENAFAVMFYPTRLLEIEFPAVNVGVSYVKNGRSGVMASLGVLTAPLSGRDGDGNPNAVARGPIRGVDLGLEGRYYPSPLYNEFPIYLGVGGSYSLASVTFNRFVPNASQTFSRLQAADAQGRRIRGTAVVGWEWRTGGFALDLTTGIEISGRGLFTDDPGLIREFNQNFWNINNANQYNLLVLPIMRMGIGIGKW